MGGYTTPAARTNTLAIISFVAGLGSFFAHVVPVIGGFTVALVAIVTGFIARGQIKQSGEQGMWMANAGIILGFVHLALGFILLVILLILIFLLGVALFGVSVYGHPSPTPVPSG
jgi:Ni,Fe-hydrogenase I cytochrome b subunit